MKKLLLIMAVGLIACEQQDCQTCTETTEKRTRNVFASSLVIETEVTKYALCEQADIDEVNGKVVTGPQIYTSQGVYYRIVKTTTCE